ncbi:MAG: radical SAM protein [Elusimicrobia bacterium]|nr:radical SAM protein [Elusimicrobiota bacterium]
MQQLLRAIEADGVRQLALEGRFAEAESQLPPQAKPMDAARLHEAWARTLYEAGDFAGTAARLHRCVETGALSEEKEFRARVLLVHLYRRLGRMDEALAKQAELEARFASSQDPYLRNQMLNEREITEGRTELKSHPNRLTVRLTNQCNIRCSMCVMPDDKPWSVSAKTISEVKAMTPYLSDLQWQGGEPLIVAGLPELIESGGRNPHLSQNIITNGLLIDRKWAELLVRNRVHVRISIDGADKEMFEKIRCGGSWEKLLQGISCFNEERVRQNQPYVRLELHMLVMRSNYRQVAAMVDFAHEHRFDILDLSHIVIGANPVEEDIFERGTPETWAELQRQRALAAEKAARYKLRFGDNLPFPPAGMLDGSRAEPQPATAPKAEAPIPPFHCLSPWKLLIIREGGGLVPNWHCIRDGRHMDIGHCEKQSLMEGWNSPAMQEFRKRILARTQRGKCTDFCLSGALVDHWRDHIEWI